eukprot:TRINITY_DN15187_c0_g1_i1.p1 TRINITY_DN15187_c0_g1~~TRINITY_DN15187_c0_g1_i1.p1  ORF type:complete len:637 (-),score=127.10 TRINITY_DN15187_c0_g1_i1:20-1813(-)
MSKGESVATFRQSPPLIGNQYLEDTYLRVLLKRLVPKEIISKIEPDLVNFGERVINDVLKYGRESEANPPRLIQVDQWGNRVDRIVVTNGWDRLKDISAQEGLVSIGYDRDHFAEYSRIYQYTKVYLFSPSSAVFDCPLAMTDGAARLLELHGTQEMKDTVLKRFITREPKVFWTCGQWMTERTGGSDVGNSETLARSLEGSEQNYLLNGYKFFTSATTSEAAVLLGRVQDKNGDTTKGSRGLSVFLLETNSPTDREKLNGIKIHKLKNKLGTKAVPTAELELIDAPAKLIGKIGRGVPIISSILNITRIHNAINSVSMMRRGIAVARDFSYRRSVFGKLLSDLPLHLSTLSEMEIQFRGALQFVLHIVLLMGKIETGKASKDAEGLMRLLTPLAKLFTAKQCIFVCSEAVESLGGVGYMEDSDMPRQLRDAQVLSIWEGTTNVLSMDVLRAIQSHQALDIFFLDVKQRLESVNSKNIPELNGVLSDITQSLKEVDEFIKESLNDMESIVASARSFSFSLGKIYIASLLVEHAAWSKNSIDIFVARDFFAHSLSSFGNQKIVVRSKERRAFERILALDLSLDGKPNINIDDKLRAKY